MLEVGGTRWIPPGPDPRTFLETIEKENMENREILEKEWGTEYDSRMDKIRYAIKKEFGDGGLDMFETLGIANNAQILKMMAKYADFITEDTYHEGGVSSNLKSVEAQIDKILGDKNGAYFDAENPSHKRAVEKMERLYAMAYPD